MSDQFKLTPLGWVQLIAAIATAVVGILSKMFPDDESNPQVSNANKSTK